MARKPKQNPEAQLHENDIVNRINARDEIYDTVTVHTKTMKTITYAAIAVAVVFVIYFTLLMVYWYDDFGEYNVTVNHECEYSEEGIYVAGTCSTYGYTEYFCVETWCDSSKKIYDTEYAQCSLYLSETYVNEDGDTVSVYICIWCGAEYTMITPAE